MSKNEGKGIYYVKRQNDVSWSDITVLFDGVKVLSLEGVNEKGEAVNVYTAQWVNSQTEDFQIAGNSIIRKNVDIRLTFMVSKRYSDTANFDTRAAHDAFIAYMVNGGRLSLKTTYMNKVADVVCLKGYAPTTEHIRRSAYGDTDESYIIGTIEYHTLSGIGNPT